MSQIDAIREARKRHAPKVFAAKYAECSNNARILELIEDLPTDGVPSSGFSVSDDDVETRRITKYQTEDIGHSFTTLEEIGKRESLTRERVRQIEARAMRRIKQKMITDEWMRKFYMQHKGTWA